MPMFHPAYLLRNPSKDIGAPKWQTWQDAKEIKGEFTNHLFDSSSPDELLHVS